MTVRAERREEAPRRAAKSPEAFRTISEVAAELDVPQHVLRFWESKFNQIRPLKRGGGRRYYRPEDIDLLRGIRHLLYGDGYTIKGVQKLLRQQGIKPVVESGRRPGGIATSDAPGIAAEASYEMDDVEAQRRRRQLVEILEELTRLREMLRRRLG